MKNIILSLSLLCLSLNLLAQEISKNEFTLTTTDNFQLSAFSITNKDGDSNRPTVLLLHGGGRNKEIWESVGLVADLYDKGYNIVAFDIRGNGKSDPQIQGEFTYPIADIQEAIKWIKNNDQFKSGKIAAMGSSYGSNIIVTGSILSDLDLETIVLFSATSVTKRVIAEPSAFRLNLNKKNVTINSGLYIASDAELERYQADEIAEYFYQMTNESRRKKIILPGRSHGSILYKSSKKEVLAWLNKELPVK